MIGEYILIIAKGINSANKITSTRLLNCSSFLTKQKNKYNKNTTIVASIMP